VRSEPRFAADGTIRSIHVFTDRDRALRSDIRNLVRALDVPKGPTQSWECCGSRGHSLCRYATTETVHGAIAPTPCTIRRTMQQGTYTGHGCPLYRKEGE